MRLASGGRARAGLLAAADGRASPLRDLAGIGVMRWNYEQTGIVATIAHGEPHRGRAFERFFATGPLAMLPMLGQRSSIVWAADNRLARELIALDDREFVAELADRFGDRYGALELAGPRWHYPLSMVQATRYTDRRLALVGDAARAIHPIAGQGWNLALRDVAALAELIVDARRLGLDPGGAAVLARYERWRRFDSLALIGITDGLNRLFANDLLPLRLARELGLGAVERIPPLKRFFMRHAMGLLGDLPRLMRGEALLTGTVSAPRRAISAAGWSQPGVPNGTPAVITIEAPGPATPLSRASRQARSVISSTSWASSHTTVCSPQTSASRRAVPVWVIRLRIGRPGRSRAARSAVEPVVV